jgi:hypothetical protein
LISSDPEGLSPDSINNDLITAHFAVVVTRRTEILSPKSRGIPRSGNRIGVTPGERAHGKTGCEVRDSSWQPSEIGS